MELTRQSLARERIRAVTERTPMRLQECSVCERIMPAKDFSSSGIKKRICRECSHEKFLVWKSQMEEEGGRKRSVYNTLKGGAKRRGLKVTVSRKDFQEWFGKETKEATCFYCQQPLDLENPRSLEGLTIDRMDNSKSYSVGNMVLSCRRCNMIKGSWFSFDEMIELAEKFLIGKKWKK